jgi:predicted alpha/beta-fold hydrolase
LGHFLTGPGERQLLPRPQFERVQIALPDGDELHGRYFSRATPSDDGQSPIAIVHIFHGLAGSTESKYMPRAADAIVELGCAAILWNHRGCGDGRHRALGTYHSGRSDDLARTIRWGRQSFPQQAQIIIGYSLSGNAAILLSAGLIPSASANAFSRSAINEQFEGDLPDFIIAVNPPLDLYRSAKRLSQNGSRLYGQRFMFDLIECLKDRESLSIVQKKEPNSARLQNLAVSALRDLRPWSSVIDFDRLYTGLAGGFADHMDYYRRASSGQALGKQIVPLVVLTAEDDPITHGLGDLVERQWKLDDKSFVLDRQDYGGHMGFVDRELLSGLSGRASRRWMERRLQLYLAHYLKIYLAGK